MISSAVFANRVSLPSESVVFVSLFLGFFFFPGAPPRPGLRDTLLQKVTFSRDQAALFAFADLGAQAYCAARKGLGAWV